MIVGVGLYMDSSHSSGTRTLLSFISFATALMCETKLFLFDFIGKYTQSGYFLLVVHSWALQWQ